MTATTAPSEASLTLTPTEAGRFPAPTAGQGAVLVLAVRPFRDWLSEYMTTNHLTTADVARQIHRDQAIVAGWFGVRGRDWRARSQERFVVHVVSELAVEHVGIMLTGNPRLVAELYPHLAEPVCQHCGAPADCDHLGRDLHVEQLAA